MASDWYEEMEKAEQEYDAREYELAQEYSRGYEQGKADATEELPTSLYCDGFNDGYPKGIAYAIDEIFEKIYDVDMDSIFIYLRFDKDKYNVPFMTLKCELKEWLKEQLKSQISTVKGA